MRIIRIALIVIGAVLVFGLLLGLIAFMKVVGHLLGWFVLFAGIIWSAWMFTRKDKPDT